MPFIRSALAALLVLALAQPAAADMYPNADNAKLPDARQNLGLASYFGAAQDMDPRRHLSNLVNKSNAVICSIGDSTLTGDAGPLFTMDESQVLWGMLKRKLKTDNPQITSWTFYNRAIGGTNEAGPYAPPGTLGQAIPVWWTDPSKTWLEMIEPLSCDVMFYLFGTNSSTAGIGGGSGTATHLQANLKVVESWAKKPNVVIITNKSGVFENFDGGDDEGQSAHKGQAAQHRLFARSGGLGFSGIPNLRSMGFGLLDFGRYYEMYVIGKDFSNQYLESVPSCIISGRTLGTGNTSGENASTVCHSQDGDYRLEFTLKNAGGTVIGTSGYTYINVSASMVDANYHRFVIGSGGTLVPEYITNGTISPSTGTVQIGPTIATTAGDIQIVIVQSGSTLNYWINDVLVWETVASRFVTSNRTGGMPVNINALGTPTTAITFDVTGFWQGKATPTGSFRSQADAYGAHPPLPGVHGCLSNMDGCQGGNNANHYTSSMAAFDRALLDGYDLHVPSVPAAPNVSYNGGFQVSQDTEAGTTVFGGFTQYCEDMWTCVVSGSATLTGQRSTDAPPGSANSFLATVTAAATVAAGDRATITQPLPAYDVAKFKWGTPNALPLFVSYDVKTSVPGTYALTIKNPPSNDRYFTTFCTVKNAATWTHCGFLVPGDTGGTWLLSGNAKAATLDIILAAGSSATGGVVTGVWTAGNKYGLDIQTQLTQTNGATFQLANFKAEVGTAPTPFVSSISEELSPERLLKFYRKTMPQGTAWAAAAGLAGAICTTAASVTPGALSATWDFGSPMNAVPLVAAFNPSVAGGGWRNVTAATDVNVAIDPTTAIGPGRVQIGSATTALVVGNQYCIHARARAPL